MDAVQILLSTYNGERYLAELIESLLLQDHPNTEILVRDDGSTDGTLLALSQYAAQGRLHLVEGGNVGVPSAYFELLALSSEEAAFYAFCDQDDVWNRDKLSRAVAQLKCARQDRPALHCTAISVVNEELGNIGRSTPLKCPLGFRNALVQNVVTGCTIVLNRQARDLLLRHKPRQALMHDWWAYLVVSALGEVIYDGEPSLLYRQHGANVIGDNRGLRKWAQRLKRHLAGQGMHLATRQAREFRDVYGQSLEPEKARTLHRFLDGRGSFLGRLLYAFTADVYRQSPIDNLFLRVMILFDWV